MGELVGSFALAKPVPPNAGNDYWSACLRVPLAVPVPMEIAMTLELRSSESFESQLFEFQ